MPNHLDPDAAEWSGPWLAQWPNPYLNQGYYNESGGNAYGLDVWANE